MRRRQVDTKTLPVESRVDDSYKSSDKPANNSSSKGSWFVRYRLNSSSSSSQKTYSSSSKRNKVIVPVFAVLSFGIILFFTLKLSRSASSFRRRKLLSELPPLPPRTYEERLDYVKEHVQSMYGDKVEYLPIDGSDQLSDEESSDYDIYNCPDFPPKDYPREYPIMDVLNNWPIEDTSRTDSERLIHQGICIFDFSKAVNEDAVAQLKHQILTYRQAEFPFVIRNDPSIISTVERWNSNDYMFSLFDGKTYKGEYAPTNVMMNWAVTRNYTKVPPGWKQPTHYKPYSYPEWYDLASSGKTAPTDTHHYIRMDACLDATSVCDSTYRFPSFKGTIYQFTKVDHADFLFDELPFFNPASDDSELYLVTKSRQRGIQCRMGMEGLVAVDHCDADRNFIAVLGGERRYLLSHPKNCLPMSLYPMGHPFERHSQVDWSAPNVTEYPDFPKTNINEVVLQAGDILYVPTQWFHHIVSLTLNFQCNTRSGYSSHYAHLIRQCGFHYRPRT